MLSVSDIMTSNVITVPSDTPMFEAEKIMEFHKIERLPIVDKGKLVGLVTKDNLLKASPSKGTSFSRGELFYLLAKMTVKDIMVKKVVTVSPDTTVEQAAAIAQKNKVGSLPVLEDGRVVGIVTTNDFFYKILNPLLGIGEGGKRIAIQGPGTPERMQKVLEILQKAGVEIKTICSILSIGAGEKNFVLHLNTEDATPVLKQLKEMGFKAEEREHTT